jgi:hypothetical protein
MTVGDATSGRFWSFIYAERAVVRALAQLTAFRGPRGSGAPVGGCPTCGEPLTPGKRFCRRCGAALFDAAPALATPTPAAQPGRESAAERRVCSVLFCDVVGFTPLSESRDPEAVRELLSQYFAAARTVITRYGGVVEKFIGDAVMAIWGTP